MNKKNNAKGEKRKGKAVLRGEKKPMSYDSYELVRGRKIV